MDRSSFIYKTYVDILKAELVPAMGCTEPIAIAYCASKAKDVLGEIPTRIEVIASGNIIKNVKSVIVPHSGGKKGISTAAALGALAGDSKNELQVLSSIKESSIEKLDEYIKNTIIDIKPSSNDYALEIMVKVYSKNNNASVRIINEHTNIVEIIKNNEYILKKDISEIEEKNKANQNLDYDLLTIEDIIDFANTCDIEDVKDTIKRQIEFNSAIAKDGLTNIYGANIGKVLLKAYGDKDVKIRAKALASAGSDARMNGCEKPVIINSGSGNQGLTCSLPVIEYAKTMKLSEEELIRALLVSNLVTLHEKSGIGRLSAYCGAVSAGAGAGAGIAYLNGGRMKEVSHTIVNALAITSGIVCDGAKSSCAAKIASAVDAGILGYEMYKNGQQFYGGEGIVVKGVENTIKSVSRLGKQGMKETDKEIIKMMTE